MRGESSDWQVYGPRVQEKIWHQAEGPALDKKREHYYFDAQIRDDDGNVVDPQKKRAEFLKDVIALANAARSRNEYTYLCLGIAEYDDWTIWGVEGRHPKRNPRPSWTKVEAHPDLMNKWAEGIARVYLDLAKQYIEPGLPEVHYETGWIEDHLIGLLVISPLLSPVGFHLTQHERKKAALEALGLTPGCSWRRLGAITDRIEPHQREWMLKSYHNFPYVPLEGWRTYFEQISEGYEYRPKNPKQPDLYQPLQGYFEDTRVENLTEFLNQFARSHNMPRVLLVTGAPGCGKTTLLERLTCDLAFGADKAIKETHNHPYVPGQPRALDYPQGMPVPVLIYLSGFEYSNQDTPEHRFCQAMTHWAGEALKLDQHQSPANILRDRDLSFVVMLDGLDEISRQRKSRWERTLDVLTGFVENHPHTRFIVTCRSDQLQDLGPRWNIYPRLQIESMHPTQARQYLGGTGWSVLLDREDILTSTIQMLCNPRRINALCEAEAAVQNLGIVLKNAIEGFIAEEHKKYECSEADRSRHATRTSKFASWLLEQGLREIGEEAAREQLGHKYFDWLYRAGLLVLRQDCCSFTEPIVHDYFAARRLLELHRNRQYQALGSVRNKVALNPGLWQRTVQIAANIWTDDIATEPMASLLAQLDPERRLQVISERRFLSVSDVMVIEKTLAEYLQESVVSLALVEQLLNDQDLSVQRAVIKSVEMAYYLEAADALYYLGKRLGEYDELRILAAYALISFKDPRGEELLPPEKETEEPEQIQADDQNIGSNELQGDTLHKIGG